MGKNRRQSNGIDEISEEAEAAIIEAERARHEEKIEQREKELEAAHEMIEVMKQRDKMQRKVAGMDGAGKRRRGPRRQKKNFDTKQRIGHRGSLLNISSSA